MGRLVLVLLVEVTVVWNAEYSIQKKEQVGQ